MFLSFQHLKGVAERAQDHGAFVKFLRQEEFQDSNLLELQK